jgi:membrane protease YdiL (CAAX protease family)
MVLFALFALQPLPTLSLAMVGLLLTTLAMAVALRSTESLSELFGLTRPSGQQSRWIVLGLVLGTGLALLLRFTSDRPLLLAGLEPFVLVAAAIGAAEELLFRGFVQGRLGRLGWPAAVLLAALAHAAYKTTLFAFPPEGFAIHYSTLALLTFVCGAALGLTRQLSGSVLPALFAHVLFDILVYGDWAGAPWWVWASTS